VTEPLTFVDTNVLAYAHNMSDAAKHAKAVTFLDRLWTERTGVVSTQVLGEFYSVLTRKMAMRPQDARRLVHLYAAWPVVHIDVPMLSTAMLRHEHDQQSWWDCLIVEAALRAGATRLATEDLQHGSWIDGILEVANPLV